MLSWEMVSLSVLIASGTVVCVCLFVCAAVSSRCSQYSLKWWGCVRLLLSVMRLPAALCCLTESSSVSWPSKLNHTCTDTHTQRNSSCLYFKCLLYCFFLSPFSHVLSCTLSYFFVLWAPSAPPFLLLPLFVTLRFFSALPSQQEFFVIGLSTAH